MGWRFLAVAVWSLLLVGCGRTGPRTLTEQALIYLRTGAYDKAIETCDEAIRENPRDAEAYLYRGRAYQYRDNAGDRERAIAEFSEAIRIAPTDPEAYYSRSIVYRDEKRFDESAEDEKMYRKLDARIEAYYSQVPEAPSQHQSHEPAAEEANDEKPEAARQDSATTRRAIEQELEDYGRIKELYATPSAPKEPDAKAIEDFNLGIDQQGRQRPLDGEKDARGDEPVNRPGYGRQSNENREENSLAPRSGRSLAAPRQNAPNNPPPPTPVPLRDPWLNPPAGQVSPWLPRTGGSLSSNVQPQFQTPYQMGGPFPQRVPHATGFTTDAPQTYPYGPIPRTYFNNPFGVPTSHLPGAYHNDYNP